MEGASDFPLLTTAHNVMFNKHLKRVSVQNSHIMQLIMMFFQSGPQLTLGTLDERLWVDTEREGGRNNMMHCWTMECYSVTTVARISLSLLEGFTRLGIK